ncbi:MAG: preprotein translocase subunit SecE [Pseudomonadota bacterium]
MTSKTSVAQFVRQIRQEISKVTWPTRRDVTATTIMVFLFVLVMSVFFLLVDQAISFIVRTLLSLQF